MTIVARTYWLRSPLADLSAQCSCSSSGEEFPSQSVNDMPSVAHTTAEGQQPGIMELDDEVESYTLLRRPARLLASRAWFMVELHGVYHSLPADQRQHSAIRIQLGLRGKEERILPSSRVRSVL